MAPPGESLTPQSHGSSSPSRQGWPPTTREDSKTAGLFTDLGKERPMTESNLQRCRFSALGPLATFVAVGILAAPTDAQVFVEHVISANVGFATWVLAADLDGDGDTDVVGSGDQAGSQFAWYENNGDSLPAFTERIVLTTGESPKSVLATDVDGDGDVDLVASLVLPDLIVWYENNGGSPPGFDERIISTTVDGAISVATSDLDGDGDTDVLATSINDPMKITSYQNDGGSPPTFTERIIDSSIPRPQFVLASDVDDDGDIDVLSAAIDDHRIAWYENDGGLPPAFTEWTVSTEAGNPGSLFAIDLDDDGDTDVLATSDTTDEVAWYESDGAITPTFSEHVITTSADGATSVFAADVNGDGDIDVISSSTWDDKIAWYESDGGSPPTFTEQRVISTEANGATSVFAADVDGDGDIDVLSASALDDKIAWYENPGLGASVTGMKLKRVLCGNATTGQKGGAIVPGTTSWSCDDLGVWASSEETVQFVGVGTAGGPDTVGGSVNGLALSDGTAVHRITVICQNLTTAQTVWFKRLVESWDCEAEGLIVATGNRIQQSVRGEV
jgi:hypothetical protein